jgi:hypothetical protein
VPNPAFIVEGSMEQKILARICSGQPIRRIGCNGDEVSINRMCDFIETQIRTLKNKNYPIVIIFDREKRTETCAEIEIEVLARLNDRGLDSQDIRVFVADREAEDWYLKDVESICNHYGLPEPLNSLRGKGGIERLIGPAIPYHETTVGVELFFVIRHDEVAKKCDVFRRLIETAKDVDCRYFAEKKFL